MEILPRKTTVTLYAVFTLLILSFLGYDIFASYQAAPSPRFIPDVLLSVLIYAVPWLFGILLIRCGTRFISRIEKRRDVTEKKLRARIRRREKVIVERINLLNDARRLLREEIEARSIAEERALATRDVHKQFFLQFSTLMRALPDHLYMVGLDNKIIWKNNDLEEDGLAPPCCVAQGELETGQRCDSCALAYTFKVGESMTTEIHRNGQVWRLRTFPVTADDGLAENVLLLFEEVTTKIRSQEESLHVAQLASIGELAASVAHEINNPVNGIINLAQVLNNRVAEQPGLQSISGRIIREGERVAEIVKNLLNLSRKDDEPRYENVADILSEVLTVSRKGLYHDGIEIYLEHLKDVPVVRVNGHQVHQIVLNLLTNARHAFAARPAEDCRDKIVRIRCSRQQHEGKDYVRLAVWDNALGIAAAALEKVVLPFYTTKGRGVGTGLGLSICKEIAEKHSGFLMIDSVEGAFTEVAVYLPCDC